MPATWTTASLPASPSCSVSPSPSGQPTIKVPVLPDGAEKEGGGASMLTLLASGLLRSRHPLGCSHGAHRGRHRCGPRLGWVCLPRGHLGRVRGEVALVHHPGRRLCHCRPPPHRPLQGCCRGQGWRDRPALWQGVYHIPSLQMHRESILFSKAKSLSVGLSSECDC